MRGQSAVEYLMTYGWALLILVGVLGLLYSMGTFNPGTYTQEQCLFQPSVVCKSMLLDNGNLRVVLLNDMGFSARVNDYKIIYEGKDCSTSGAALRWDPGATIVLSANCANEFISGNSYNFQVVVTYNAIDREGHVEGPFIMTGVLSTHES